ncbi:MAG: M48 family metallopeptidase [Candidatus Puniceispirillaceae bacterium]
MQFQGRLTKAGTTALVEATLRVADAGEGGATLILTRADMAGSTPVTIAHVLPKVGGGDLRLRLSTGDVLRLPADMDTAPLERFFPEPARLGSWLTRLETVGWRGVLLLSVLFLLALAGLRLAIAPAGDFLARLIPDTLVERASGLVLAQLDLALLEDSRLPDETRQRLTGEFERLRLLAPPAFADTRLHFRHAPAIGPNAFALPGHDIVLLDELVTFANDEDVVLAVLAHEFGHVVEQHALRQIMRSAVVAIAVGMIVGADESIIEEIVGFGGNLVLSGQSRAFELEADHVSADWMQRLGRDAGALPRFFSKLQQECGGLCDGGGLLATHPSFRNRIEALTN